MGILFTILMGFLFTITLGILLTIVLGIQFTISITDICCIYRLIALDRSEDTLSKDFSRPQLPKPRLTIAEIWPEVFSEQTMMDELTLLWARDGKRSKYGSRNPSPD